MVELHELEPIEASTTRAQMLVADARRSLSTCRAISRSDPKSGLLLARDGIAFSTLAAALTLAGYRVTNRRGPRRSGGIEAPAQPRGSDVANRIAETDARPRHVRDGGAGY
jgi:hypothetical protein